VTGRGEAAWLADLAETLTEVDEFLRSPAGHAALKGFYAARGSIAAGFEAGNLIDAVGFTALWLRGRAAPRTRLS
jgi:hypothetical protein